MRHFVECAPCESVAIADFDMHAPVNFAKLGEIIRDVIGDENEPVPEGVEKNLKVAVKMKCKVSLNPKFHVTCDNGHFFTLYKNETNWEHSWIEEDNKKLKYNEKTGEFEND